MLQSHFLDELFKSCTLHLNVFKHTVENLQDRDISKDAVDHKKILIALKRLYKADKETLPTIGIISQMVNRSGKKSVILDKVANAPNTPVNNLLAEFDVYIKGVRTEQTLYDFQADYNKGNQESSRKELFESLQAINEFSVLEDVIPSTNPFQNILNNIESIEEIDSDKVPFSIPQLDKLSRGGIGLTDTALFILRSGVGKSTLLKYLGYTASVLGNRVIHFQLEGTEKEVQNKYNQTFSGLDYTDVSYGNFGNMKKRCVWSAAGGKKYYTTRIDYIEHMLKKMEYYKERFGSFDIEIIPIDELGTASMNMVEAKLVDYIDKNSFPPDLIIIDSLDLMYPGDGNNYGIDIQSTKMRIQNSARIMKNLSVKYKTRIVTATQTSNVDMKYWNDESFVLDRGHSLGDKGVAIPFSFVITGNRTIKEKRLNKIRWFVDKLRDYEGEGTVISCVTDYDHGMAIDLKETLLIDNNNEKVEE